MKPNASRCNPRGAALLLVVLVGCSGSESDRRLRVGHEPGDSGGSAGVSGGAGQVGDGGIASGESALSVRVQDADEMTIEVLTLACAGDCADIEAVAHGGNPPYAFAWEDGSKSAKRHVCLDASKKLTVSATDTAIDASEFHYEARSVSADVDANVLDCSDAAVAGGGLCIANPSFEGTLGVLTFNAPPWNNCVNSNPDVAPGFPSTPDLVDGSGNGMPPTQGATYASLGWDPPLHEFVIQALCAPLLAGVSYSFTADLATAKDSIGTAYPPAQLAVYGSANDCKREELLWKSPPLATSWKTYCITLTPTKDAQYLVLEPTGEAQATTFTLVDNLVPVPSCP